MFYIIQKEGVNNLRSCQINHGLHTTAGGRISRRQRSVAEALELKRQAFGGRWKANSPN